MLGQAPRSVRFEHMVLQHERPCIGPVVWDVQTVVVAHHVRSRGVGANRIDSVEAALSAAFGLCNEAVHLAAVNIGDTMFCAVGSAAVGVLRIVIRLDASSA